MVMATTVTAVMVMEVMAAMVTEAMATVMGTADMDTGMAWTRQLEPWALEPWPLAWPRTLVARPLVWIRSWCLLAVDARRIYLGLLLRLAGLTAQQ